MADSPAASVPESPWKTASREAWDATYGEGDFDRRLAESVEKSAPCIDRMSELDVHQIICPTIERERDNLRRLTEGLQREVLRLRTELHLLDSTLPDPHVYSFEDRDQGYAAEVLHRLNHPQQDAA